ncbi:MAG: cytochrome C, partial [bacterium]
IPVRKVIFSHKTHVEQEIDCKRCHVGIEKAEGPNTAFLPVMATCNSCHDGIENVNACGTCHTRVETLMPLTHKQVDWFKEHKRQVKIGGISSDCSVCHEDNFCQSCHVNPDVQFTRGMLTRPLLENRPQPSGGKMLVKQRVHQLNFVFYHAIDFRSKRADCYTCHDQQKFCNECHSNDQDAGFRSPIPFSHRGPDFVRIGAGSGGGRHARLARTDIETCASCHDVEGRDPACLTCHVDRSPGKGNDPRTHRPNFMRDENGDWHANPASMCYNCHTNTQRAGIGFCGYCHGAK